MQISLDRFDCDNYSGGPSDWNLFQEQIQERFFKWRMRQDEDPIPVGLHEYSEALLLEKRHSWKEIEEVLSTRYFSLLSTQEGRETLLQFVKDMRDES